MKGLVTIAGLEKVKLAPAQTNLPPVQRTTATRAQILHRPVFKPVNKQAALIVAPNRSWVTQPAPDTSRPDLAGQLAKTEAKLKVAHNEIGELGARLGNAHQTSRELRSQIQKLENQLAESREQLKRQAAEKALLVRKLDRLDFTP